MKRLTAALALLAALGCAASASADTISFVKGDYDKQRVVAYNSIPDGKITVDGDLSDWADIPVRNGVIDDVLDHTVGSLNGDVRGAATFRFAHDSQAFYAAVQVVDPSIEPSGTDNIYEGDAVEFFLDFRPLPGEEGAVDAKNHLGDSDYTDGTAQIMVAAPVDGQSVRRKLGTLGGVPLGPYDVAAKTCPGGYCVELRIPYTSIVGYVPGRMDQEIGFDVSIDDIDAVPGGDTTSERRSFAWSGDGNQWQDASSFGLADPRFDNSTIPAPLLRTAPATYARPADIGLDGKGRVLVAGDIAPIGTPVAQTGFDMNVDPSTLLGTPNTESTDYPDLGVTVRREWWPITNIAVGTHKAVTGYAAGIKQAVHFKVYGTPTGNTLAVKSYPADTTAPDKAADGAYILPNGMHISPVGKHIPLPGDMPQSFVWLDGSHLAVNTGGYHDQGVDVIDVDTNKVIQTLPVNQTFGGMDLLEDGLIVPGGAAVKSVDASTKAVSFTHVLYTFEYRDYSLKPGKDVALSSLGDTDFFAGCAGSTVNVDKDPAVFAGYVANINADRIYRLDGFSAAVGQDRHQASEKSAKTGYRPYAICASSDSKKVAVANWGDKSITFFDSATLTPMRTVKVGSHPVALAYSTGITSESDGSASFKTAPRWFVACSGSNEVDVIRDGKVEETIKTSLDPRDIIGSTPDALAVSHDGRRLYVANADNNDICVVDISVPGESRVVGFIPTGWYPSAITVSPNDDKLYIGIGKGLNFSANADGKYIAKILNGAVSVVDVPSPTQLAGYTRQVAANVGQAFEREWYDNEAYTNPASMDQAKTQISSLRRLVDRNLSDFHGKIKHVLYIIRENRTYDQILGDDPRGNGDPNIVMFGKDVTPNAHKLADNFVLLDNLYCSGEVSENGHQWCDSAYATDFVQRAWPQSYSGKGEPDADDRLVASPAGYLWDNCARHGVSYYAYGEGASFTSSPTSPPIFNGEGTLKGHSNAQYGVDYWNKRDTVIDQYFITDLHKAEKTGNWPNFIIMSLPEDHTHGLGAGSFTPAACVASNDQALGQIVDAVSHSKFWKSTAIFVIEDDAQDGPDHVDAHRTVGLVISPYIKHGYVDHMLYTTASYIRTMEDILGLPYLTQFDENATPLADSFDTIPVLTAYADVAPKIDVMAKNQAGPAAVESAKLDFSAPDRIDPQTYNRLLWQAVKPGVPMPAPVRRGLVAAR